MSKQKSKSEKPDDYYLRDLKGNKVTVSEEVYKEIMRIEDSINYDNKCWRKVGLVSLDQPVNGYKKYDAETALLADAKKEAELRRQETIEKVNSIVPLLDPEDRMIIELYYFQGVSQKQISSQLGIKQAAVSKHLRKARLEFLKLWYLASENEE